MCGLFRRGFPRRFGWCGSVVSLRFWAGGIVDSTAPEDRRVGLIALLICVFPANIYMAIYPERFEINRYLLWIRLPIQPVMMAWVWWVMHEDRTHSKRLLAHTRDAV